MALILPCNRYLVRVFVGHGVDLLELMAGRMAARIIQLAYRDVISLELICYSSSLR